MKLFLNHWYILPALTYWPSANHPWFSPTLLSFTGISFKNLVSMPIPCVYCLLVVQCETWHFLSCRGDARGLHVVDVTAVVLKAQRWVCFPLLPAHLTCFAYCFFQTSSLALWPSRRGQIWIRTWGGSVKVKIRVGIKHYTCYKKKYVVEHCNTAWTVHTQHKNTVITWVCAIHYIFYVG